MAAVPGLGSSRAAPSRALVRCIRTPALAKKKKKYQVLRNKRFGQLRLPKYPFSTLRGFSPHWVSDLTSRQARGSLEASEKAVVMAALRLTSLSISTARPRVVTNRQSRCQAGRRPTDKCPGQVEKCLFPVALIRLRTQICYTNIHQTVGENASAKGSLDSGH